MGNRRPRRFRPRRGRRRYINLLPALMSNNQSDTLVNLRLPFVPSLEAEGKKLIHLMLLVHVQAAISKVYYGFTPTFPGSTR